MRRVPLIVIFAGAVALAMGITIALFIGQTIDRNNAVDERRAALAALRTAVSAAQVPLGEAVELDALAGDPLLPADPAALVDAEGLELEAATSDADALLAIDADGLGTPELRELTADLRDATDAVRAETDDLETALGELVAAVTAASADVDAAAFDANNAPRIAFRTAVADLALAVDDQIGEQVTAYVDAARGLEASHAAELAEKAGPLFDARMAVQQFARSLSGGVLLEFDWAPTVNGYGLNGSYGGTSYWTTADGGQSTVTLSDSVARQWPSAGVQALVVHEVGHAVLARLDCNELFFESDLYPGEEESWATAWAIGMGYTADGSGETVYGRPSDALIALSQQCR